MIIVIQCNDEIGLVAAISTVIQKNKLNIIFLREHVDLEARKFFVRLETGDFEDTAALEEQLKQVLPENAEVKVNPEPLKKLVVLVTKEHHCLADILIRNFYGTLGGEVMAVIGNHPVLQDICVRFDIPFHLISHEEKSKEEFEQQYKATILGYQPNYIILAKFMRILSANFVAQFNSRLINIHHSFLPAFIGANPYKQAFERGVKLIGATAHFVTNDLDQGPIIAQQIISVNHAFTAADMMKAGREVETSVLVKALKLVFEDRVFISKNKTVVFE
jgi:formyltetrahydrofolate deformylase